MSNEIDLTGKHLVVSVPTYDGKVPVYWIERFVELYRLSQAYKFNISFNYQANGALITNNRNIGVAKFRQVNGTHLLFIDSDILFNPIDIVKMMAYTCIPDEEYNIICGPYPLKNDKPEFHCDLIEDQEPSKHGLWPIKATGCGFMMITKETIEKMIGVYPELVYYNDFIGMDMHALFHQMLIPRTDGTMRYIGEDVAFCKRAIDKGIKIWMDPAVQLTHIGFKEYNITLDSIIKQLEKNHE